MFHWLRSLFWTPRPVGPAEELVRFSTDEPTVTTDAVSVDDGAIRIDVDGQRSVALYQYQAPPGTEHCMLSYSAALKAEGLQGKAYLEMWCQLPGRGRFFSKGLDNPLSGSADWADFQVPFYLKAGEQPDLLLFNLHVEGKGTVWIRDIRVSRTPLA